MYLVRYLQYPFSCSLFTISLMLSDFYTIPYVIRCLHYPFSVTCSWIILVHNDLLQFKFLLQTGDLVDVMFPKHHSHAVTATREHGKNMGTLDREVKSREPLS